MILVLERQPEVRQAWNAVRVDQNVRRLDVPMKEIVCVGVMKRVGERRDQGCRLMDRVTSRQEPAREVATVQVGGDFAEQLLLVALDLFQDRSGSRQQMQAPDAAICAQKERVRA